MNRRTFAGFCAALLIAAAVQPAVYAETVTEDPKQNLYLSAPVLETVASIDLPSVLERALTDSNNLQLLLLKYAALNSKEQDLKAQRESLVGGSFTGGHLPDTPEEMVAGMNAQGLAVDPADNLWLGPVTTVTNKAINQLIQGMGTMSAGMNEIIQQQREQLKTTAHQLSTDQRNALLQKDEAVEAIRLQTTAQYVQLLGLKKQLAFMQDYASVLDKEVKKAMLFREQGLASNEDVLTATKALNKHKDELALLNQNYKLALVQLSFDIGIAYNPSLEVKDIANVTVEPVQRADTETILKNAYQMKMSANNIDEAAWQQSNTVTQNTYGGNYLGVNLAISGMKNEQTQLELTKKIEAVYTEAENAYLAYTTEARNTAEVKADLNKMKVRYDAGVLSRHDLQKFELKVRGQETTLEAAKLKYFVLREKARAMEKGFIS